MNRAAHHRAALTQWRMLGECARLDHRHAEAIAFFRRVLAYEPHDLDLLNNLAVIYLQQENVALVAEICARILKHDPAHVGARGKLAWAQMKQGQLAAARQSIAACVAAEPDNPFYLTVSGEISRLSGDLRRAEKIFRHVASLAPDEAESYANQAFLFLSSGAYRKARRAICRALALAPHHVPTQIARAQYYRHFQEMGRALDSIMQTLALAPLHPGAQLLKGLILLQTGQWREGWRCFGARDILATPRSPAERWQGETLARLVLTAEQGIGDEIMFAALLLHARARTDNLSVECDPRLLSLFRRSFPTVRFFAKGDPLPAHDGWASIGDLGGLFRPSWASFSGSGPYLIADAERAAALRQKYRARFPGKSLIGLSWFSKSPESGAARSIPFANFAPLLERPGLAFISLQYEKQEAVFRDDCIDPWHDLDGLSAQIQALDLVITIDNNIAHLAGALGIPTLLLLPKACDWRWHIHRRDSPWYPSLTIVRQEKAGDWRPVIATVEKMLPTVIPGAPENFLHGLACLAEGNYRQGWKGYGWRFAADPTTPRLSGPWPEWDGDWSRSLLIWGEQGIGEEIFFARLIPQVLERQRDLVILCDPRLKPILARSFPNLRIVGRGEAVNRPDLWSAPFGDFAAFFWSSGDVSSAPWLRSNPSLREKFRQRYVDLANGRPVIGFSWTSPSHPERGLRSREINQIQAGRDGFFVSLQYGAETHPPGIFVDDTVDPLGDLESWMAQIDAMDEIVTIDNSTAHMAGALGKNGTVFLRSAADWRWGTDTNSSSWYPNLTLVRDGAVAVAADDLKKEAHIARREGNFARAERLLEEALRSYPKDYDTMADLAALAFLRDAPEQAERLARQALVLSPRHSTARRNYAAALLALGKIETLLSFSKDSSPSLEEILPIASALSVKGRFAEARTLLGPLTDDPDLRFVHAMNELRAGNYRTAWPLYKARFARKMRPVQRRSFGLPEWRGEQVPALVIAAEQGLGDEIMFARFLLPLTDRCGQIALEVDERLHSLYRRSFPSVILFARNAQPPILGTHEIAIGDLPSVLDPDLAIPPRPYLIGRTDLVRLWRRRYRALFPGRKIVGIGWKSGNLQAAPTRTLTPKFWANFSDTTCTFVSLQYDATREERAALGDILPRFLDDPGFDCRNDIETLAVHIMAMDRIVSADHALVHLAGALGQEVKLFAGTMPDWRWPYGKAQVPWYARVTLCTNPAEAIAWP
jgi:tetratricopeptide (TPR) repeat protein